MVRLDAAGLSIRTGEIESLISICHFPRQEMTIRSFSHPALPFSYEDKSRDSPVEYRCSGTGDTQAISMKGIIMMTNGFPNAAVPGPFIYRRDQGRQQRE
jgi:hypothetical protein